MDIFANGNRSRYQIRQGEFGVVWFDSLWLWNNINQIIMVSHGAVVVFDYLLRPTVASNNKEIGAEYL